MAKYGTLDTTDLLWSEPFRSCTQRRKLAETPVLLDWSSHCTVLHGFPFKVMQFPNFGAHVQEPWCWVSTWYVAGDDLKWHPGQFICSVEPARAVRPLWITWNGDGENFCYFWLELFWTEKKQKFKRSSSDVCVREKRLTTDKSVLVLPCVEFKLFANQWKKESKIVWTWKINIHCQLYFVVFSFSFHLLKVQECFFQKIHI